MIGFSLAENFHNKDKRHSGSINHPIARMQENVILLYIILFYFI
jgi:hypothetical protein